MLQIDPPENSHFREDQRCSKGCIVPCVQTATKYLHPTGERHEGKNAPLNPCSVLCWNGLELRPKSPDRGTWKLNEAKSKTPAGLPKNSTVIYAADGDNIKVTTDGTGGDGKPTHTEWTGKFDGKDYPLTGDPTADSRSYKMIDEHTLDLTNKKGGKATTSGKVEVSKDGKTRTLHLTATDPSGKKVSGVSMYNKQ